MKNLRSYFSVLIVFCLCLTFTLNAKNRKQKPRHAKDRESKEVNAAPSVIKDRRSSAPYITGDGFRSCCDHIIDEENTPFYPQSVKNGDKIFVKTDLLAHFFQNDHSKIQSTYVLITHNSDHPIPGSFARYLDDEKILGWFGQNAEEVVHPKLHPIPIGLENRYNKNGNPDIVRQCMENFKNSEKQHLVYMNFTIQTAPTERTKVYRIFETKPYCKVAPPKPYTQYLQDLAETQFTLSPRGNGLDCHRTWESLYLGAIPIMRTSASDAMYDGLPVLIIQNWNAVTKEFLEEKYREIQNKKYVLEKLYIDYWLQRIEDARTPSSN
ncbi:MAG TPA: hypothetical protein VIJ14_08870 [Rhabdochlamydiaceae bacterium]